MEVAFDIQYRVKEVCTLLQRELFISVFTIIQLLTVRRQGGITVIVFI